MGRICGLCGLFIMLFSLTTFAASLTEPIKLGMSAAFTGRAERLGQDYLAGAQPVFTEFNQQGGIGGRKIQLLTLDDGYEPDRTMANTRQLVLRDQVLALFGYIGTPTSNAVLPLLRREQVPFLAPFSGADLLRQPEDQFIFNLRASYAQEAASQIRYLVDQRRFSKIALLIQADEFGASVERNFLTELANRSIRPLVVSRFKRNTTDLQQAINLLVEHKPDLVLTVGTYQVLLEAMELAAKQQLTPLYSVVSFTGVSELAALLNQRHQVIASMVMPDPRQSNIAMVQAYRAQIPAAGRISDVALEGFAAASLVVAALKQCAASLNRSCLLQALPQQQLAGFPLQYDVNRHQASQQVFLVRLTANRLEPISEDLAQTNKVKAPPNQYRPGRLTQ